MFGWVEMGGVPKRVLVIKTRMWLVVIGGGGGGMGILDSGGGWVLEWECIGVTLLVVWTRDSGCSGGWKWVVWRRKWVIVVGW